MQMENEQFVQALLDSGEYESRDAVVDAAIARWRLHANELAALRAKVQVGIDELDRGEGEPLDIDSIIAEGRARLAAGELAN